MIRCYLQAYASEADASPRARFTSIGPSIAAQHDMLVVPLPYCSMVFNHLAHRPFCFTVADLGA